MKKRTFFIKNQIFSVNIVKRIYNIYKNISFNHIFIENFCLRIKNIIYFLEAKNIKKHTYSGTHRRYEYIYKILKPHIRKGKVIDCACGTGEGSKFFTEKGYDVKGYDKDITKVEETKIKGINANYGDITHLPEDDDSADIYISSETLEHLTHKDSLKAANDIKRIVKNEGYIIITVPENEKLCLENKLHKQYLTYNDLQQFFYFKDVLHRSIWCKTPGRCNLIIIFKNLKE